MEVVVDLFDSQRSAQAFLQRQIADFRRFQGIEIDGNTVEEFQEFGAPDVGTDAVAVRLTFSTVGLKVKLYSTFVAWIKGPVVARIGVGALDDSDLSAAVNRLALRMDQRIDGVPAGEIRVTPLPMSTPYPPSTIVTFPDENLDTVIRDALGKQAGEEITAGELAELTTLDAKGRRIADLSSIRYCTNLTTLFLQENLISDLSPLSTLNSLPFLFLEENLISDLSPLASLTKLEVLALRGNPINDVSPLASLTKLGWLHLDENQISDLSPLASLTKLTKLWLGKNQIRDLSPLASLTNLKTLALGTNQISDVSPLASLTKLHWLFLDKNQISDISPLVENSGLGEGDRVGLGNNNLDLSEGSEDLENIRQLEARGVMVN